MISLILRIPSDLFPTIQGEEAGRFMLDMLKENPQLALDSADHIEVNGDFGKFVEER